MSETRIDPVQPPEPQRPASETTAQQPPQGPQGPHGPQGGPHGPQPGLQPGPQQGPHFYRPNEWGPPQGPPVGPLPPQQQFGGPPSRGPKQRAGAAVLVAALAAGLVGGGAGAVGTYALTRDSQASTSAPSALDSAPPNTNASTAPSGSVQAVADKVLPSVVTITINTGQGTGGGSGIILSADGQILTNNHVAEAGELEVTFQNGKTVPAQVVGLDPVTDLAVIKAQGVSGLKPATLGSSDTLKVGQQVVAIGAPIGLNGTVTTGIVSALNRPVNTGPSSGQGSDTVIDAIQTDAAINPGNSGGALLDMSGRVVGINTAIAQVPQSQQQGGQSGNIGLGFAIPIDEARPIAKQLAAGEKPEHALLGVQVGDAQGQGGTTAGAMLGTVTEGSSAAEAGLQEGDVVTKLDNRTIADGDSLVAAVRSHRPGDEVTLTYVRDGREQTAKVKLGSDR